MGILFNSTALGIHFCETSLIFNFKTRLGGEICLCDVNMHKGYYSADKACVNFHKDNKVTLTRFPLLPYWDFGDQYYNGSILGIAGIPLITIYEID